MKPEEIMPHIGEGALGALKHMLEKFPVLGEAIAGYDAYKRSIFERNVENILTHLKNKAADLESLFSDEGLKSDEGQKFFRKVFDSAVDAQLEDKQELFVNALINGIENKTILYFEKMKFVDVLRNLSLASLMVLSDMHNMFKDQVRGPGRVVSSTKGGFPLVDHVQIAEALSSKHEPYLVTSAIYEMESQGLFSNIGEWQKATNGSYRPGSGFANALTYTDFTYKFVEFITHKNK